MTTKQHKKKLPCYADLTDFPKIFNGVYWGGSRSHPDDGIIENRNKFIKEHNIISSVQPPQYIRACYCRTRKDMFGRTVLGERGEGFDHVEVYKTSNKEYVILNSPYNHNGPDQLLIDHGWELIDNLYSNSARTYMLKVPMRTRK